MMWPSKSPPRTLYKYVGPELIGALEGDVELRFTPPDRFNDPFEALPRVRGVKRESVRRKLQPGEDLDELMRQATPYFRKHGPSNVLAAVSETFGVLCLAAARQNPLLWAHYAEGHTGFAIGLDPTHVWFSQPDKPQPPIDNIQRVVYRWRRPSVMIGDAEDFSPFEKRSLARAMLCTKYVSWRYEREWRLIRPLAGADRIVQSGDDEPVHLFQIPTDAITEVIVGARMPRSEVDRVRHAAAHIGKQGVPVRTAQVSRKSFALDMSDLETG